MSVRYPLFWLWLMAVWLLVGSVFAQPAPGEVGDALNALLSRGMVSRWLKNEPITTSIRDVNKRVDLADSFGNDASFKPIHRRPRTVAGGYLLSPGFYELRSRSY